jgi:hypothetical protein
MTVVPSLDTLSLTNPVIPPSADDFPVKVMLPVKAIIEPTLVITVPLRLMSKSLLFSSWNRSSPPAGAFALVNSFSCMGVSSRVANDSPLLDPDTT